MALHLELNKKTTIPLEVEGITPECVSKLSRAETEKLQIHHGNRTVALADFFSVDGDAADGQMHWHGDLAGVHWIGAKMSSGLIRVEGDAGRHLGSEMSGGELHVDGDAGDWVGAEMHGGLINVRGRAGHLVGAAYRGSRRGMTGGSILIGGAVGNELGHSMRRGLVAVGGNAGDLVGFNMLAGTILVLGAVGIRHGAGMRRGTIGLFSAETPELLPSFRRACRFQPQVMTLIWRQLQRLDFTVPSELLNCDYELYNGDFLEGGRGEILLRA